MLRSTGLVLVLALLAAGCRPGTDGERASTARTVDQARLLAAADEPQNWLTHGGTYLEQRFSPLTRINAENVGDLKLAWFYDLDTNRGQEATPIIVDGVMYTTSAWSKVYALDAATGEELWTYDPKVPGERGFSACCDVVNRGVAVYDGRIYFGTLDGRLIALDAKTGKPEWSVVTVDQSQPYTITGAPRIVKGRVVIGNGGAEYGVRGYVSAYDTATGKMAWRFYTVPGDPNAAPDGAASDPVMRSAARPTWNGEWWKLGGGGTVWDAIVYDPELDSLYIGVGNGSPWNHKLRSAGKGDNLFLSSVVALNPDTGAYKWHYQETPGETWDFTATQPIILADLAIDGRPRKVLMQAPKNGFFYVLDRTNGRLISAKNFVPVTWASGVDPESGRPIETKNARFTEGEQMVAPPRSAPTTGTHGVQPQDRARLSSRAGGALPLRRRRELQAAPRRLEHRRRRGEERTARGPGAVPRHPLHPEGPPRRLGPGRPARSLARPVRWPLERRRAGDRRRPCLPGQCQRPVPGLPGRDGQEALELRRPDRGDRRAGQLQRRRSAVRGGDGRLRRRVPAQLGVRGQPARHAERARAGVQARRRRDAAQGRADRGGARQSPAELFTPAVLTAGRQLYEGNCSVCHGPAGRSSGVLPDLRRSGALADRQLWQEVVIGGSLKDRGMVSFAKWVTPEQAEALRAYVGDHARKLQAAEAGKQPMIPTKTSG
jgi:quinohemoprotein ethanol dehydrogenase